VQNINKYIEDAFPRDNINMNLILDFYKGSYDLNIFFLCIKGIFQTYDFFMGDRGNICIYETEKSTPIFLYTHWGGSKLLKYLQTALQKHWRWTDAAFLTRIIFCVMIEGHESDETGFGISTSVCDNEHPIPTLYVDKQLIVLRKYNWDTGTFNNKDINTSWSFNQFCGLDITKIEI
jgi:hypothetical protein